MNGLTGTKGAAGVWQRIISEMPEHTVYIEPFWGRGVIARRKRPARCTIGLDLDPAAVSNGADIALMFRADALQWLSDYFRLDPPPPDSAAEAASPSTAATFAGDFCTARSRDAVPAATFAGASWADHFCYLDPPYLGCHGHYKHELSEADHRRLCRLFLRLPCPAALSGYRSELHAAELSGCRSIAIPSVNRAGRPVVEMLWLNFPPPRRYHDTRFCGTGRRERERIHRRARNWAAGLARMGPAERQAVFEYCAAVMADGAGPAELKGPQKCPS